MVDGQPPLKKSKSWHDALLEQVEQVKSKHCREEMLNAVFNTWDRDGSGELEFEEVLPHYMKAANHQDLQEKKVREGFEKFMRANSQDPTGGLTPTLFKKWLGSLSDDQVAVQYARCVEGFTEKPYGMNINKAVDKDFEGKSLKEILDSPISTIQGLTDVTQDALALLNLETVRDLGNWRFYLLARAIVTLAEKEDDVHPPAERSMNIREALDREHETKTLKQVLKLPPSAFNMFPSEADDVLKKLKISTIQQLGSRKTFAWANAMVELERYEITPKSL